MFYGYGFGFNYKGGGISVDPDAQAFITAASITDPTQQSAVNQLVADLKAASLWTKMKAVYPFVGGSASSVKFNLKDPQDTDAAFRLTISGGVTYTNGFLSNGTTGYANTHITPSINLTADSTHIAYDCSSNVFGAYAESGLFAASGRFAMYNYINGLTLEMYSNGNIISTQADTSGFYVGTRTASNDLRLFRNGSQVGSTFTGSGGSISNANIKMYFGALNNTGSAAFYTPRNYRFFSVGDGLTPTEAGDLRTAVNAFNTTLGR